MYSPNFRLPTLTERHPDGVLYASERKNREEERQDRELGQRVDRLRARLWAIIERSRRQQEGEGSNNDSVVEDSDTDTSSVTPDDVVVAAPSPRPGKDE